VNKPGAVRKALAHMVGQPCWRREVGEHRSLSLGFGKVIHRRTAFGARTYGEWEAGTYDSAWRILEAGDVICGSADAALSRSDTNSLLATIELGPLVSTRLGTSAVRLNFASRRAVEFLRTGSGSGEWFHVFCPRGLVIEAAGAGTWRIGRSDGPWSRDPPQGKLG
jgi:hypothetical protein